MGLRVNEERFYTTFESYSRIGGTENGGLHRIALSDADQEARDVLVEDLEAIGASVRIDEAGNVFGRREGTDPSAPPVLIGSHLDSQPYGGRYDGQLGVLAGLETLRTLADEGIETKRPIELVNWTNEEGARFDLAPLGVGVFTGKYPLDEALATSDDHGRTVEEELERIGYDGNEPCEAFEIDSYLELHIEQGPKLENRGVDIGVVTGVVGLAWLMATFVGDADHAGTTPMHSRENALVAAARAVGNVSEIPVRLPSETVITTGELTVDPNSTNIIPGEVNCKIDIRSYDDESKAAAIDRVRREIEVAAEREGVAVDIEEIYRTTATGFSRRVQDVIHRAVEETPYDTTEIVSSAGHDAMYMADVTDAGMVFVPSVGGKSHSPDEYSRWDDVLAGTELLLRATEDLATR